MVQVLMVLVLFIMMVKSFQVLVVLISNQFHINFIFICNFSEFSSSYSMLDGLFQVMSSHIPSFLVCLVVLFEMDYMVAVSSLRSEEFIGQRRQGHRLFGVSNNLLAIFESEYPHASFD
jgi:hypothetical protein